MHTYKYYLVDGTIITQNCVNVDFGELVRILGESKTIKIYNPDTLIFVDKIVYVVEVI